MNYKKYIKPYIFSFILGPLLMITEVLGEIIMPVFLQRLIDIGIVENRGTSYFIINGIFMVITAVIMMLSGIGGAYFAIKASTGFSNDLRKDVFKRIQEYSFLDIDKFSVGSLITRLTNDITIIQNFIAMLMRMALRAPGMLIGATIMAFFYNKKLSIIIIIVIPILAIILMFIIKKSYKRFNKMQKSLDKLNNITQENLTNIRVVKSFVRENFEKDKFEKSNEELKEKTISAMNIAIFTMPVMTLFMNVTTLLVMFFGGKMVIANSMSVGELTAFINYILQILMSLMMLSMVILNSSKTFSSLNRVKEVMDRESSISDKDAMYKELHVKDGKIEFESVYFKYFENSEDVLKNISFTIEKGENIGIIGSTGSGKTSLISLITRLYEPYSGEIRIDGINIKDYSFKNLRNKIAVVLQNNTLFSGTIEENIRWGVEDASENDIFDAAINAQADGFIRSFKDGYKTVLEQGGANLSGGQKQRICIARALIKKPRILILDDSTSAVDTATEGKIKNSLNKIYKDTTKIIIAQRISSVFDCSKIIVLDEGEIVGIGNHNYLMENNNEYREIYYSQMEIKK